MANILGRGLAWLTGRMNETTSEGIEYSRGLESIAVGATLGKTVFEQTDAYGIVHRFVSRDFIFPCDALRLAGQPATPAAGDRISLHRAGRVTVYEVTAPGAEQPYTLTNADTAYRVHTKLMYDG